MKYKILNKKLYRGLTKRINNIILKLAPRAI